MGAAKSKLGGKAQGNAASVNVDWEAVPRPPTAARTHALYVGVMPALCVWPVVGSVADAALPIVSATAARFALVGWLTRREYVPWPKRG